MRSINLGQQGERLAETYLKRNHLKLIERNSRCRFGEIDLIMLDRGVVVFVEVRLRKHTQFGTGAESVTITKQLKLRKTASLWLGRSRHYQHAPCRFDVISIDTSSEIPHCIWYKDAFRDH